MQIIELPSHCDRAAAAALHPEFLAAAGEKATKVDASKVERLGFAVMQLLVSADHTEGGIALNAPSEPFVDTLRLAGLETLLADGAE